MPINRTGMYGWLLRGKGFVSFFELVGCGHVFGVFVQNDVLRAMMNVRWMCGSHSIDRA